MAKALRTAALVVGAVALVATTAGLAAPAVAATATSAASAGGIAGISAATLGAIGTWGTLAAGALSAVATLTAKAPAGSGNPTKFTTDPTSGLPYAIGRTRMSGLRIHADTTDGVAGSTKNDTLAFAVLLSVAGPIEAIESFSADTDTITFAANGQAIGDYNNWMSQKVWLGGQQTSALTLTLNFASMPGWTSTHKLSGCAHALWMLRYSKDGSYYGAGVPEPAWIGKWVKAYDPRKDSTYPGGSGTHRAYDESTYEWTDNPGLHALTWVMGRYQNGKRVCGMGAPWDSIVVSDFVENANICDANNWKVGGVQWTTDSKWDILKRILQAGGAQPTKPGAMIGCQTWAPRTAIATIKSEHLLDSLSIATTQSRRDRFNTVIPKYIDEASQWETVSGVAITEPTYVTMDQGQRTKEIDYPLVQVFSGDEAVQPGQLAAYDIVNSREAGPITFTTGPQFVGLKTGDVVYLDVPEEGLDNQPILITKRSPDPSTGKVSFAAQTETYSKHAYALGQSTTPPAPFSLSAPDVKASSPEESAWTVSGATSGEGFPALLVTGTSENENADSIVIGYRLHGDEVWISSAVMAATGSISHVIAPLESETAYDVRIAYRIDSIDGNATIFSNVLTGKGKVTEIEETIAGQDAQLAQLEADSAAADAAIAAAQASISNLQDDAAALQSDMAAAQADILAAQTDITSAQADILANSNDIATAESTLASHGASITTLQTTATSQAGQIATINSTLSTQGASITSNTSAITTLQGSVATLNTRVSAGSPNLLTNGGFENGLTGWTGANFSYATDSSWGPRAIATATGTYTLESAAHTAVAGATYTIAADTRMNAGGGSVYVDLIFKDSSGNVLLDGAQSARSPVHEFSSTTAGRAAIAATATAPSGSSTWTARFVVDSATSVVSIGVRQIKVERASTWSAWSSEASVTQSFTSISTLNTQYASLSSTVSTQGASITTLQSSMTTANGSIATLQSQMTTANANISTNASAISGINTSVATINSTLSTQGASITANSTAITTLQTQTATLTTQVRAGMANLVPNGGFENGLTGWSGNGGWTYTLNGWGPQAFIGGGTGTFVLNSAKFPVFPNAQYTAAADWAYFASGGVVYIDLQFFDASNNVILDGPQNPCSPTSDFHYDGSGRNLIKVTANSPANAVNALVRFVVEGATGLYFAGVRQVKVEQGATATAYSNEASVTQSFSALSTLTTQYASLSSTVSTQGVTITSQQTAITTINNNVTTLFGRYSVTVDVNGNVTGWEVNNNGTVGDFKIRADKFQIVPTSGTGARTEFSGGNWRVYDASNVLRTRFGVW